MVQAWNHQHAGLLHRSSLKPSLVRINEVHEVANVVTMAQTGIFFSHFQSRQHFRIITLWIIKHPLTMRLLDGLVLRYILSHPIADFPIGCAVFHKLDEFVLINPSRFQPETIKSFTEVVPVIRSKFSSQMQPDYRDNFGKGFDGL